MAALEWILGSNCGTRSRASSGLPLWHRPRCSHVGSNNVEPPVCIGWIEAMSQRYGTILLQSNMYHCREFLGAIGITTSVLYDWIDALFLAACVHPRSISMNKTMNSLRLTLTWLLRFNLAHLAHEVVFCASHPSSCRRGTGEKNQARLARCRLQKLNSISRPGGPGGQGIVLMQQK